MNKTATKTAEEITTTLTTCPGKIDALGYCNHCGQRSQLSGYNCYRLIPVPLEQQKAKTAEEIAEEIMQAGQFGGSQQACAILIKQYAEQAIDHFIDKWQKEGWYAMKKTPKELAEQVKNNLK